MEIIAVILLWVACSAVIGLALIGDRCWTTATRFNAIRPVTPVYQPPGRIGMDG